MAQISIIKKSELEGAMRLDAEYYQPRYRNAVNAVHKYGSFCELSKIGKVLRGKNPTVYSDSGIPVIRAIDLRDITKTEDFLYADPKEALFLLKKGDILISSIGEGSIGKVQVFQDTMKCATVSEVSVIRTTNYSPYALATFLKTSYGYLQLERRITGSTGQLHLYPKDIATVIVPLVPSSAQKTIEDIGIKSDQEFRRSKALYLQAEHLLLDEVGFKTLDLSHQLSYMVSYKKAKEANRLDAEHFQPKYEQLISHLATRVEVKPLGSFLLGVKKGIEVGGEHYQEKGKLFIRVSNLSVDGFVDRDQKYISEKLYDDLSKDFEPKVRELLLTKDATPGIAYVLKEPIEGIISSGILKLTIDETAIDKEYLALCINSVIGKLQIERDGGGSVITHWKPEQIKRLKIPALDARTQKEIASLIQQSHEARRKARQLLEEAKLTVENLIDRRTG